MFNKINVVPRWIIFFLDLTVCAFSLAIAYLLRYNLSFSIIDGRELWNSIVLIGFVNAIVFYSLKTYAGIIRYTSTQDSIRILLATFFTGFITLLFNIAYLLLGREDIVPISILVIYAFCSFVFLISYRVLIKIVFAYLSDLNLEKKRVVIYGAGQSGIITKRTIDQDLASSFKVIAFLDDDDRKIENKIDGVKIYNTSKGFKYLIRTRQVECLIISIQSLSTKRMNEIVDLCLLNNIKVLNVPPINNWINGELSSKQIQNINIEDLLDRDTIEIHNNEISDQIRGKRVLISGAAGSIGSELVRQLTKFEPQLIILCDQSESALYDLELELQETYPNINFQVFIGDVRNKERMHKLFSTFKPHHVYHAAAYKHVPLMENNPAEAIMTNVLGTRNLADLSIEFKIHKFVMISTDKAVNPSNVMGASKRIAEIYIQSLNKVVNAQDGSLLNGSGASHKGTKFITTRFGNVLGSNGSVIPRFKAQIEKGGPVTVTHPDITRYFMTIPEACQLVLEAGSMGKGGEIFIFDMGESVKISELAKKMIRLSGFTPGKDMEIIYTGLRPGEKLYEELLNDNENNVPTHHSKIMIAKVREYNFDKIHAQIDALIETSGKITELALVKKMKSIVPEFKSNNSVFEELDSFVEIVADEQA